MPDPVCGRLELDSGGDRYCGRTTACTKALGGGRYAKTDMVRVEITPASRGDEFQDPSADLKNVNAAYVIERDEAARLRVALEKIATLTDGMKREVIDFENALKWAKHYAREALNGGPS